MKRVFLKNKTGLKNTLDQLLEKSLMYFFKVFNQKKLIKKSFFNFTILTTTFLITACEKDITVDLPAHTEKIVVDGFIEQGGVAHVTLTRNFPFFQPFADVDISNPGTLEKFLVLDAQVFVNDGLVEEELKLTLDMNRFPPIFFKGENIIGQVGKTYFLRILVGDEIYTSQTTIREPVPLDSINFRRNTPTDSLGTGMLYFQDPPEVGNIYRLFVKRQGYPNFRPHPFASTIDDQIINGQYISYPFNRPNPVSSEFIDFEQLTEQELLEMYFFKEGDTITVKFCTIDRLAYNFIRTYESAAGTSGNPFVNPTTVQTNINGNNVLGGWVGYSVSIHQTVAK